MTSQEALNKLTNYIFMQRSSEMYWDVACEYIANDNGMTHLKINHQSLENIDIITDLLMFIPSLRSLDLSSNEIENIGSLNKLTWLTSLELCCNKIYDIEPLSNLINLNYLSLSCNNIKNLSPLRNLSQLTILAVWRNPIEDIPESVIKQGVNAILNYYR